MLLKTMLFLNNSVVTHNTADDWTDFMQAPKTPFFAGYAVVSPAFFKKTRARRTLALGFAEFAYNFHWHVSAGHGSAGVPACGMQRIPSMFHISAKPYMGARDMGAQASPPAECSVYRPCFIFPQSLTYISSRIVLFNKYCVFRYIPQARRLRSHVMQARTPALPCPALRLGARVSCPHLKTDNSKLPPRGGLPI